MKRKAFGVASKGMGLVSDDRSSIALSTIGARKYRRTLPFAAMAQRFEGMLLSLAISPTNQI